MESEEIEEIEAAWVSSFRKFCEFYVIPTLFSLGLIFNSASLVVLFGSTLQLKKSLVILFPFSIYQTGNF